MTTSDELMALAIETACEAVLARDAVLALRQAAEVMANDVPPNDTEIRKVAKAYGIPVRHRQLRHIIANLTDMLLDDVSSPGTAPCKTIRVFADERLLRAWQDAGILPTSAYHESARSAFLARESCDEAAISTQTERCELALAYPAKLVARIATAALEGSTAPMLGAFLPEEGVPSPSLP